MDPARYSALEVAGYFIRKANSQLIDEGIVEGISNLKLQKILYFSQAAHLALHNSPIFTDEIQAWKYGPVIPVVYQEFNMYTNKPIPAHAANSSMLDEEAIAFLKDVWDIFGKFTAGQLVDLSHNHRPWKDAYSEDEPSKIITLDAMKSFYDGVFVAS